MLQMFTLGAATDGAGGVKAGFWKVTLGKMPAVSTACCMKSNQRTRLQYR